MTNQEKSPILTITLNPAMDVFVHVNHLDSGTLHRASEFRKNPGGKGINVSKALNAFGTPTVASGFIGGYNGEWVKNQLMDQSIPTRFAQINEETRMNIKVVEAQGKLTELNSSSPALTSEDWTHLDGLLEQLAGDSSWVAFCGNLPGHCSPDWYEKAIQRCRELGLKTAVDTSGEALKHAVKAKPDFIKPNIEELEELTGKETATIEEVVAAAEDLAASGISTVAVTIGAKGMVVAREMETWVITVPEVDVVSPVGAGDSVVAGFLHGFYHQEAFSETIRFAAACGVAAVMKDGTAQPEPTDVESLLSKIKIEKREVS
ncbi:MAG TPA: 1-phosphofructokinase [Bacillales bacterium]